MDVKENNQGSIEEINQMNKEEFVSTVGWVFEHSPWVAEKAWESIPFKSREELLQIMVTVVKNAEAGFAIGPAPCPSGSWY